MDGWIAWETEERVGAQLDPFSLYIMLRGKTHSECWGRRISLLQPAAGFHVHGLHISLDLIKNENKINKNFGNARNLH